MIQWVFIAMRWILNESGNSTCDSYPGCSLDLLRELFTEGDSIECVEKNLDGKQSFALLNFLNSTNVTSIRVSGAPTVFDGSEFQRNDVCLDYTSKNVEFQAIQFQNFQCGILHCELASVVLNCVVFRECFFEAMTPLAFVDSDITVTDSMFKSCKSYDQSFIVGYKCRVNLSGGFIYESQIHSAFICPVLHFLETEAAIKSIEIKQNDIDSAVFFFSNTSRVIIEVSVFTDNQFLTLGMFEHNTTVIIEESIIENVNGSLVFASGRVNMTLGNIKCRSVRSSRHLISLNQADLNISQMVIENSRFLGGVSAFSSALRMNYVSISGVQSQLPVFNLTDTLTTGLGCSFQDISSSSDVSVFVHSMDDFSLSSCHFKNLSTSRDASTALSVVKSPRFSCDHVIFEHNSIGFCICEESGVSIINSYFKHNQYFPANRSLPYAILLISQTNDLEVKHSEFIDNRAVTGTFLLLNTSVFFTNSTFKSNSAVQGSAIFSGDSSISIELSKFHGNTALANGGAISLLRSPCSITSTNFKRNQADEGGAIYAINCSELTIKRTESKGNEAADGVFIYARGDTHILLEKTKSGVFPDKSISASRLDLIDLRGTLFNCQLHCELIEELGAPIASESSTPPITLIFGVIMLVGVFGFAITTKSFRRFFFRLFRSSKGKHIL